MKVYRLSGPLDSSRLSGFDASYSSEYIYRVIVREMTADIRKEKLPVPVRKTYALKDIEESIAGAGQTIVAEDDAGIAGFAAVKFENWNKRALLMGIYVAPEYKSRGIGKALIKEAVSYAKENSARCLWVETQNLNYPAVTFYLKTGFRFCGFDDSLYDPDTVLPDEIALFFRMDI